MSDELSTNGVWQRTPLAGDEQAAPGQTVLSTTADQAPAERGSAEASRRAAAILEVLAGVRGPSEAAATCHGAQQALAGSLNVSARTLRYWKTSQRSGQFEARPRGRPPAICDVDGIYPYIFAVRDLASHRQLAWQPVASEKADAVLPVLADLMREHGAPLVLKSDNGSAFVAEVTKAMLDEAAVSQLFSPAGHPQFNGSLERSNATLKTYTHQQAIAEGHPFGWTSDDLERARELANTISRPWGHRGPSPDQRWRSRTPITDQQRAQFEQLLTEHRSIAAEDLGLDLSAQLSHVDRSRLDRLAIGRTLEELAYLTKRRVLRAPRKPKRPSREKLARHHSELAPASAPSAPRPEKKKPRGLACMRAAATMQASSARREQVPQGNLPSPLRVSAQRERANSFCWRKPITLLLSILKAAKITR